MIVAIVSTAANGVVPVREFREAVNTSVALAEMLALYPTTTSSDWTVVETGWVTYRTTSSIEHVWAYDFDQQQLVEWWVDLATAKQRKKEVIDARTAELVVSGYVHAGRIFSSSEVAQKNLEVLDRNKLGLSYPFMMATKDNSEIYAITSAVELGTMYQEGLSTVLVFYQSGNALKQAVIDATSIYDVVAITDTREETSL